MTDQSTPSVTQPCSRGAAGLLAVLLLLLPLVAAPQRHARAAVLRIVTTLDDVVSAADSVVSLREAIGVSSPGDGIDFAVTGTLRLDYGELTIPHELTIRGPGADRLTISGNNTRIFNITGGPVYCSGLTLSRGEAQGTFSAPDAAGGAIQNGTGALTLVGCAVMGCRAVGGGSSSRTFGGFARGGGIRSSGPLTLRDCTVGGNTAEAGVGTDFSGNAWGGGIYCTGPLTLVNSTVAENETRCPRESGQSAGGGIYATGAANPTIIASTIARNTARTANQPGLAAGIYINDGSATFRSSLVADNHVFSQPSDVIGEATSQGFNLIGARDGSFAPNGNSPWGGTDRTGTKSSPLNPHLGSLGENAGSTETCRLNEGSPAIDQGDPGLPAAPHNLATDQRGFARRLGSQVDIGAFERDVPQPGPVFTVNTLADTYDGVPGGAHCTLREALLASNVADNPNVVNFRAGLSGSITLGESRRSLEDLITMISSHLLATNPVRINGPGARVLKVGAAGRGRVLTVTGQGVVVSGLTLRDGFVGGSRRLAAVDERSTDAGGCIVNTGALTLTGCAIVNNRVSGRPGTNGGHGSPAFGGAIANAGTLTLVACSLTGNLSVGGFGDSQSPDTRGAPAHGGALYNEGTATLVNCTLSANTAEGGNGTAQTTGGAPGQGGGIFNADGSLTLRNCTVARNRAVGGFHGNSNRAETQGGGLYRAGGVFRVRNTLIALNPAFEGPDAYGTGFSSDGSNLVRAADGSSGWITGDRTGTRAAPVEAVIQTLENNGGPTDTHALLSGSPAINRANPDTAPARDQRDFLRSGAPDIGAFEFGGQELLPPVTGSISPVNTSSLPGRPRAFTTVYTDPNGAEDLASVSLLVNKTLSGAGGLYVSYDAGANKLYLRNAANTAWLGGQAPGADVTLADAAGSGALHCGSTTVTRSGNKITVTWSLTPNQRLVGNQNLYLFATDSTSRTDGWDKRGGWSVSGPPVNVSVSPSPLTSPPGAPRTLAAAYSDPNGAGDIRTVYLSVNTSAGGGLFVYYDAAANRLYLRDKANSAWLGGHTPGSANTISEPSGNGSLSCAETRVVRRDNSLVIYWRLTPAAGFAGEKGVFLQVRDAASLRDGWDALGSWTISP